MLKFVNIRYINKADGCENMEKAQWTFKIRRPLNEVNQPPRIIIDMPA